MRRVQFKLFSPSSHECEHEGAELYQEQAVVDSGSLRDYFSPTETLDSMALWLNFGPGAR